MLFTSKNAILWMLGVLKISFLAVAAALQASQAQLTISHVIIVCPHDVTITMLQQLILLQWASSVLEIVCVQLKVKELCTNQAKIV
jgi:hypothetical protein